MLTERTARQLLVQVLQPVVFDYAEPEYDVYLPKFAPYNLKAVPSDYSSRLGAARSTRKNFTSIDEG